jgi:DNA-binding transcriptional LysR family regulator
MPHESEPLAPRGRRSEDRQVTYNRLARAEGQPMTVSAAIDLRHVRYFLAVSEELHFGRAARRLHVTQPPLSAAIRRLEDELGVRLLDRTSRSVVLTDAGRVFADESRKTLAALHAAVEETRRAAGRAATRRIGCVPSLPLEWLLEYIEGLRRREPGIWIQIANEYTLAQLEQLRAGALDLAIVFEPGAADDIETEPLFAGERLALYVPAGHRLATNAFVGPADLGSETLIMGSSKTNPALFRKTLDGFAQVGYRFRDVIEVPGPAWSDLEIAVASGLGVAISPVSVDIADVVVRCTLRPPLRMPAAFVAWRRDTSPALRGFVVQARQVARALWAECRAARPDCA